ncbi:MAG: hypothetical protein AAGA10_20030 [Bacteroidota bacterium]
MHRKYFWGSIGSLLTLSCLFTYFTLDPYHAWGGDFALYLLQTQSLAEGNTHQLLQENAYAMDHSEIVLGPHLYPPGFPLLLFPSYWVNGLNLYTLKFILLGSFLLFQIVLIGYFRKELSHPSFLLFLSLFSLNPWLIRYCDFILSDIPFLLVCTLSLSLIRGFYVSDTSLLSSILLGASMAFAYMIRTVGIVLLGTFVAIWILKKLSHNNLPIRQFHPLISLVSFLLIGSIGELSYPSGHISYLSYLYPYEPRIILDNLFTYFMLPRVHLGVLSWGVYVFFLPLCLWGIVKNWRRFQPEITFMVLYTLTLLIWPFTDGLRFVFPLLPFAFLFSILGLEKLLATVLKAYSRRVFIKIILPMGIILLLMGCIYNVSRDFPADPKGKVNNPESRELFSFIRENTSQETQIAFFRPRILRLFTRRTGIALKGPESLSHSPVDMWIQPTFLETIQVPADFTLIFSNKEFQVFAIEDS